MDMWTKFVDWAWTPTVAQLVEIGFYGWIISLAVAATLKLVLRRAQLNAKLEPRLPKSADGEGTIDLEDKIVDGVYWSGVACTTVVALYGAFA